MRPTTTAAGSLIEVEVLNGEVGGPGRVVVSRGILVTIRVMTDVDDEIHVHGYDVSESATPTGPAELSFVADIPGIFEVEFEDAGLLLFELVVR